MASFQHLDPELWQHLPVEILEQVLPRLPLEAIFRFRAVCKKWYQLPLSPSFRASCMHPISQGPFLLAMRYVEDLRLTPVLSADGTRWQGLDLSSLHQALTLAQCNRINAVGSGVGLLCVSALSRLNRNVIVVCNPLTQTYKLLPDMKILKNVVCRRVEVRPAKRSGHYRVYIFGEDLLGRDQAIVLYKSSFDSVSMLLRFTGGISNTCGALWGPNNYYTLSRSRQVVGYNTKSPRLILNTGIVMDRADSYKILAHNDRLFCATAEQGTLNPRDDTVSIVEFRIYELDLATGECRRLNINLQCLFVHVSPHCPIDSCYDWDFVAHKNCLLIVARSGVDDDPQTTRWLEINVVPPDDLRPIPALSEAFGPPCAKWRFSDNFGSRSLLLNSFRLDLNAVVSENQAGGNSVPEPQIVMPGDTS